MTTEWMAPEAWGLEFHSQDLVTPEAMARIRGVPMAEDERRGALSERTRMVMSRARALLETMAVGPFAPTVEQTLVVCAVVVDAMWDEIDRDGR